MTSASRTPAHTVPSALAVADPEGLAAVLTADPGAVHEPVDGLVPVLYLLRRSMGSGADVRACARVLLEAGADANAFTHEVEDGGDDLGVLLVLVVGRSGDSHVETCSKSCARRRRSPLAAPHQRYIAFVQAVRRPATPPVEVSTIRRTVASPRPRD